MLHYLTDNDRETLVSKRKDEEKLGENIQFLTSLDNLKNEPCQFVLLGIKEDIGIRANLGVGGATDCWDYTLKAFLNIQDNVFLSSKSIAVAGFLDFSLYLDACKNLDSNNPEDLKTLREYTSKIDDQVREVIIKITKQGKTPIIIGGGHNNSYGNITGVSEALNRPIAVLNIDPHSDFRALEGRHSGNGFSYAWNERKLNKYAVFGLHESYNGADIVNQFLENPNLHFESRDNLLWRNTEETDHLFKNTIQWLGNDRFGLELDLDSITQFPVSALNPSGFSLNEVRNMVRTACSISPPLYFHICEGSPGRANSQQQIDLMAKSIAYLIADFIKCSKS